MVGGLMSCFGEDPGPEPQPAFPSVPVSPFIQGNSLPEPLTTPPHNVTSV